MFSQAEKRKIAKAVENVLLEINHPEMPDKKPVFHLHVKGKSTWSWADIEPNWKFEYKMPTTTNWNENARSYLSIAKRREN